MSSPPHTGGTRAAARARWLAHATIGWNVVEAAVAVTAGLRAGSIVLLGFGIDAVIEVASAGLVLWRLRGIGQEREGRALWWIGLTFLALAGYVAADAARRLLVGAEPATSTVGIVLAGVSVVVMPALAVAKRRVGREMGSPTVLADATETLLCAYLSAIVLVGLVLNASAGWWWADPVAALGVAVLALREGREARAEAADR